MHALDIGPFGWSDVDQQMRQRGTHDTFEHLCCGGATVDADVRGLACLWSLAGMKPKATLGFAGSLQCKRYVCQQIQRQPIERVCLAGFQLEFHFGHWRARAIGDDTSLIEPRLTVEHSSGCNRREVRWISVVSTGCNEFVSIVRTRGAIGVSARRPRSGTSLSAGHSHLLRPSGS